MLGCSEGGGVHVALTGTGLGLGLGLGCQTQVTVNQFTSCGEAFRWLRGVALPFGPWLKGPATGMLQPVECVAALHLTWKQMTQHLLACGGWV